MPNLKLLSWNVNGLRSAAKKGLAQWLADSSPDIACFQETKCSPDQLPQSLLKVDSYNAYFASADKKGYSGVATYTRTKPVKVDAGFGMDCYDCEGRTLVADFGGFLLYNVYFPNGKASPERLRYKMEFYRDFLEHLKAVLKKGRKIIICGDVNTAHKPIDLARPKENEKISGFLPQERAWMDEWIQAGFVDTFRHFDKSPGKYSWWTQRTGARARNVGWRLDYFFISENLLPNLKSAFIQSEVMGSDHCPVGIELEP